MNKRVKAFFSMGTASIFQILLNIIRNKLTAVILGTYGIGILSIINSILGIAQPLSNLSINNGIVKKISEDENNKEELDKVITTAYITTFITSTLLVILMIIFSKQISIANFNDNKYYVFIIIIALSIPISTFNSIDVSIINGFRKINIIAKISISTCVINIFVSVFFIYNYNLNGAIYSIIIMTVISYIINFVALKKIFKVYNFKFRLSIKNFKIDILKTLTTFGMTSIFALLFTNISLLIIKGSITKKLGIEYNGIFQADWAIINQYVGIVFSSCAVYYFPSLCALKTNEEKINEMNKTLEMLLVACVPLFIGVLCFKDIVISTLYSSKFLMAADLLSMFIIGDYFKIIAWTLGYAFLPINKVKEFIIIDFCSNVLFTLLSIALINMFANLYGVAVAYVILNVVITFVYYFYLKVNMNFRFEYFTKKNIVVSFITLSISYVLIVLLKFEFRYNLIICLILLFIWGKIIIDVEKINKIKCYLKKNIKKN